MIDCMPQEHFYMAMGIIARGNVSIDDINKEIENIKKTKNFVWWNKNGFKYGICSTPPIYNVFL